MACITVLLPAQVNEQVSAEMDWSTGTLTVVVSRPLPETGRNLPAGVTEVRAAIQRDANALIVQELRMLPYDSLRTVNELLTERPELVGDIVQAASAARMVDAHATTDLRRVEVTFELNLYNTLLSSLADHDRPRRLQGQLGWAPADSYTGILIYAAGPLRVFGSSETARLQPTLLPGIYQGTEDGDGIEKLMEAEFLDPDSIERSGPVLYSDDVNDPRLANRIGVRPLRIIALAAFGRYPTDVVIGYEDGLQILANENNRSLIANGRIAIIIDPDLM